MKEPPGHELWTAFTPSHQDTEQHPFASHPTSCWDAAALHPFSPHPTGMWCSIPSHHILPGCSTTSLHTPSCWDVAPHPFTPVGMQRRIPLHPILLGCGAASLCTPFCWDAVEHPFVPHSTRMRRHIPFAPHPAGMRRRIPSHPRRCRLPPAPLLELRERGSPACCFDRCEWSGCPSRAISAVSKSVPPEKQVAQRGLLICACLASSVDIRSTAVPVFQSFESRQRVINAVGWLSVHQSKRQFGRPFLFGGSGF